MGIEGRRPNSEPHEFDLRPSIPKRLWVCWKEPEGLPDPADSILTFLLPSAEHELKLQHSGEVLFGREASLSIRKQARSLYLSIAARLAAVPAANGRTLRQLLSRPGRSSLWWYHPVSFKECEADPTFDWIIALCTIVKVAEDRKIEDVTLVGGPAELTIILKEIFRVQGFLELRQKMIFRCLRSVASRLAFAFQAAYISWLTRSRRSSPKRFDVGLLGFWEWSVRAEADNSISDVYFRGLPEAITAGTDFSVGWFAWLDKLSTVQHPRSLRESARLAGQHPSIFILQSTLGLGDVLRTLLDFRPLAGLLNVWRRPEYRAAFQADQLNLFPLFKPALLGGALDYSIPYCDLVAVATERACRETQPRVTFSFMEHFLHARAHYEGVKQALPGAISYTIQHASYCSEKTFLFLDPELEFRGKPDGCAVPRPDYVLAMGAFARELFLECGYAPEQVLVTGSPRYDQVRVGDLLETASIPGKEVSLLLVGGTAIAPDLEMIDAACHAVKHIPELRVSYRKHPFSKIEGLPWFHRYRNQVKLSQDSLDEDLKSADIVLFTYSTVAEEAFLRGRPVWQWLSPGFNGSALSEVASIPRFGSVESLCDAIRRYISNPAQYAATGDIRNFVLARLFYRADGQAATRIAALAAHALGQPAHS